MYAHTISRYVLSSGAVPSAYRKGTLATEAATTTTVTCPGQFVYALMLQIPRLYQPHTLPGPMPHGLLAKYIQA